MMPRTVLVIGSGPIVIGQAAEFDYAGVQACRALREEGCRVVLVNSNPATIMTDPEMADAVYLEPLVPAHVEAIIERERPDAMLATLGGQTGLNLAVMLADRGALERHGVRLLGTPLRTIRLAEDRELFKKAMLDIGEPVPESAIVRSVEEGLEFAQGTGYPLVVRPAYTLGGTGGGIAHDASELRTYLRSGLAASIVHQVLLETSLLGWKEIEYEVLRDGADNCVIVCNMENIDPMGVHTGDSIVVAPSQTLSDRDYQMPARRGHQHHPRICRSRAAATSSSRLTRAPMRTTSSKSIRASHARPRWRAKRPAIRSPRSRRRSRWASCSRS